MDPNQPYYQFSNTGGSSAPVRYFGEINESQWEDPSFGYGEEEILQPLPNGADIYPDDPFPPTLQTWPYFPNQQYDRYPQSERYNHFQTYPQGRPGRTYSGTHGTLTCLNCGQLAEFHGVRCQSCKFNRSISPEEEVRHCMKCLVPIQAPDLFCPAHQGRRSLTSAELDQLHQFGVCYTCCSREVGPHDGSCTECRARRNVLRRNLQQRRLSEGYCNDCGMNPLDNSTERCNECHSKNLLSQPRYRSRIAE